MIEKEMKPIMMAVIKTTYAPVLKRAMVNSVLLALEQLRVDNFPGNSNEFLDLLRTHKGHRACGDILSKVKDSQYDLIKELMKQYGIHTDKAYEALYMDELSYWFHEHLEEIAEVLYKGNFSLLAQMSEIKA